MTGSLHGLKVLDCTHVLAGAMCSLILADLGADVVKIEPLQGEATRGQPESRFNVGSVAAIGGVSITVRCGQSTYPCIPLTGS